MAGTVSRLATSVLLLAAIAEAKSPRLIVEVVGLDQAAKAAAPVLSSLAENAARASGRFEVLRAAEAVDLTAAESRTAKAAAGAELVTQGQKDLDDLDPQKAMQHFTEALAAYREADLSREDVFDAFLKAWVLKAASHVANGDTQLAKQEIEKIIGMAPKAEFPDAFFPPDFLKVVEQQRRLVAKASGTLELSSTPPGARVWVDGVHRGVTPLTVKGLAGARHVVVLELGGFARAQEELWPGPETVALKPLKTAESLRVLEQTVQGAPGSSARDDALRAFAQKGKAEQAFLVMARKSVTGERFELTALRVDAKDGHNLAYRTTTLPLADEAALSVFFEGLLSTDAPRVAGKPVAHVEAGGGGSGGSGRTVAGISLLAASGALLVAGIACGVSAGAKTVEYQQNPQVRTQVSQNLATTGRTFSVLADVSYLTAAASAGIGTYLLASGHSSSAAAEPEADAPPAKATTKRSEPARKEPAARREELKKDELRKEEPKKDDAAARRQADEAKKKDEELKRQQAADDAARKKEEEAAARRKEEDQQKQQAAEAARKKDDEASSRKRTDDSARKKDDDQRRQDAEAARKLDEERKKKEADEKKKKDEEARAAEEAAAKKKKDADDHKKHEDDDLRNY